MIDPRVMTVAVALRDMRSDPAAGSGPADLAPTVVAALDAYDAAVECDRLERIAQEIERAAARLHVGDPSDVPRVAGMFQAARIVRAYRA